MKDDIKKAIESAEQEIQEKEIANLKSVIKDLLEKKVEKEKEKREVEKEISIIKQTIDDFKAGRLDKVKELQEKDPNAKSLLPFKIVIINQPIITQPWGWHYQIQPFVPFNGVTISNGTSANFTTSGLTGNCYATYTSGTYQVTGASGSSIINLN